MKAMDVMDYIKEQEEFDRAAGWLCDAMLCQDAGDSGEEEMKAYRAYTDELAKTYGVPFPHVSRLVREVAVSRYRELV